MLHRLTAGILGVALFSVSLPAFAASDMYDRVCPRVINRFANDPTMWERVNERIQKRFGFVCVGTANSSSSSRSLRSSSAQSNSKNRSTQCTAAAWSCSPFNVRCVDGFEQRDCYVKDRECLNPEAVRPQPVSCASSSSSAESTDSQNYLELWDESLQKLLEKAKGYSEQKNAEWCLRNISDLEAQMILRYNEYVNFLNSPANFQYKTAMDTITKTMANLMKTVDSSPTVCF